MSFRNLETQSFLQGASQTLPSRRNQVLLYGGTPFVDDNGVITLPKLDNPNESKSSFGLVN